MTTPARSPIHAGVPTPRGIATWDTVLPEVMARAKADGLHGTMPGTLLARNVSLRPDMPLQDLSIKETTPAQILQRNGYGDIWPEVRRNLTDAEREAPKWAQSFMADPAYVVYGADMGIDGYEKAAFAMPARHPDSADYSGSRGGVISLPIASSKYYPGHATTIGHEARHIAYPLLRNAQSPAGARYATSELAHRLLEGTPWDPDPKRFGMAIDAANHANHLRKPQEFWIKLGGDMKQDYYGRTGEYPIGVKGHRRFIDNLLDTPRPRLKENPQHAWDIYEDQEPYQYGPMKGTRPTGVPLERELFKHDVLPLDDPEKMDFIIRTLQHFAGNQQGATDAA